MENTRKDLERNKNNRIGLVNHNRYGSKMEVIDYINNVNITVKFEDGYIVNNTYNNFKKGTIINPFDKIVYGVGFIGNGEYGSSKRSNDFRVYQKWYDMLRRCYDKKSLERNPTYKSCSVSKEWHNYQNFARWYDENFYEIPNEKMALDKDILVKGNKIYSKETCLVVPERINALFISCKASRGNLPIGVYLHKKTNKLRVIGGSSRLWELTEVEEAFQTYKIYKEQFIKSISDEYKNKYQEFPQKLYDALYKYKVEITD